MCEKIIFKPIYLAENQGHGNARRISLANCSNNLVALMDADDISLCNRFEKQLECFENDADLQIVGGQISEFIGETDNIIGRRIVPLTDDEIKNYMKKRCPMNQVSVMMKKDFIEQVGGYIDWFCEEDYYLWIRVAEKNGKFANVEDTIVNVRIGDEMSSRRGGWRYFSSESKLQGYMLKRRIISIPRYLYNVGIRFCGEVLVNDKIRTKLFKLMRSGISEKEKENVNQKITALETDIFKKDYPPFSVAMCVYGGDNPEWFDRALESVLIKQSVKPSELVLVIDGPIPDKLDAVIKKYVDFCSRG